MRSFILGRQNVYSLNCPFYSTRHLYTMVINEWVGFVVEGIIHYLLISRIGVHSLVMIFLHAQLESYIVCLKYYNLAHKKR